MTEETAPEETQPEWKSDQFNHALSHEELMDLQGRVQARAKDEKLMEELKDTASKQEGVHTETAVTLMLYCHTAYELGVASANNDIDRMMDELIEKQFNPKCPHCGTTEMLCGHHGVGCTSEAAKEAAKEEDGETVV